MSTTARKVIPVQVKALGDRQVETIASTASLDRENDRILASAWRLDNYKRTGAPVLWGHDYSLPPIARSVDVRVVGNELRTRDEFPPRGLYDLADTVYDLLKAGFVNAKSVGFRPLKWRPNDEGGRDYTEVELLEHSYVAVPAAPSAIVVARGKGVRDQAKLDAFLRGATRDLDDVGLEAIAYAGADLGRDLDVKRADVLAALREAIPAEVERQMKWAATPDDADVLALADEDALRKFTCEEVAAILREVITEETAAGMRRVMNEALGRID